MKSSGRSERFLVIRPGALGDTILSLPLVRSIQGIRQCSITFLGTRSYRELMPPGVEFHAIDHPDWLWLFGDEASFALPDVSGFHAAYLVLQNAERIVANLTRAGASECVAVSSRPPDGAHVVEHMHLGLGLPIPQREASLSHLQTGEERDLIWVHPGSGSPHKCAPLSFIANVAQTLQQRTGWDVAVTAGEGDSFLKEDPEWHSLVGRPRTRLLENRPLCELCRELGGARIYVGNDSGISHLAAGLGIPCAIFFVATDPAQWAPWVPAGQVLVMRGRSGEWDSGETAGRIEGCLLADSQNSKKIE